MINRTIFEEFQLFFSVRKSVFIKHIEHLEEEELKDELRVLYEKIPEVKSFYALELGNEKERNKIYDKAKESILKKYKTKSFRKPRRPRIQKINALLTELEKNATYNWDMIDVYLFNAEQGIKFMTTYSFYSDPLRNTILKSLDKALLLIEDALFQEQYKDRVEALIATKIFDWGVQSKVTALVHKVYP